MTSIKLTLTGAKAEAEVDGVLTSGMVGIPVTIEYDDAWQDLRKDLVCQCRHDFDPTRDRARTIADIGTASTVAHEVMRSGRTLYLGVEGYSADGTLVIPTTWAKCGPILPGARATADPAAAPTQPVWSRLEQRIQRLEDNEDDTGAAILYTAQSLTAAQQAQARENIGVPGMTPELVGTAGGSKVMAFSHLLYGKDRVERFIFFTDPHLLETAANEPQMREYLDTLKLYHDATPTSFVIGGGDWYGSKDTRKLACFKLGYVGGWMRGLFGDRYYPALGDHDTNQEGVDDTGTAGTGILPRETVRNLWFRQQGRSYYAFDGMNTRFYVLDTWEKTADTAYYREQLAWLGEQLMSDPPENAALVMHIGYVPSGSGYAVNQLASNALLLGEAFNQAGSVTLYGLTFDFTGCTGKVRFALCGHIHADRATIVNGIPLVATTHMRDGNTPSFDLCLADYGTDTLHLIRVGAGTNRAVPMVSAGSAEEDTGSDILRVADPIVFLAQCNHNGGGINYYDRPTRCLIVTTENTGVAYTVGTGSSETTHYALPVPEGAATITVSCDAALTWRIEVVSETGSRLATSDAWMESGVTDPIPERSIGYYHLVFAKADGSAFTADYDPSGISWTFA